MPSYLWSGKDSSGQEQVERIEAANAEAARTMLLDQGWTNLQLHSSEIQDFVKQGIHAASGPDHIQQLTPKEQLAHLKGNAPGFWGKLVEDIEGIGDHPSDSQRRFGVGNLSAKSLGHDRANRHSIQLWIHPSARDSNRAERGSCSHWS